MKTYYPFTEPEAIQYAQSVMNPFPPNARLTCKKINGDNLHLTFLIWNPSHPDQRAILKQALPYAHIGGKTWPISLDRARIEGEMLLLQNQLTPGLVPEIYGYSEEMAAILIEDQSGYEPLSRGLIQRKLYPHLAKDLGRFLGRTLYFTSDYYLSSFEKKENLIQFSNPDLCQLTEELVFAAPFRNAPASSHHPLLKEKIERLRKDTGLKTEVQKLKDTFLTRTQALLHGNLHTGNIRVAEQKTCIMNPEFAFYGPIGFDIGTVIGHILFNFASQEGHCPDTDERKEYQNYLLFLIRGIWEHFQDEFSRLWQEKQPETFSYPFIRDYMQEILQDGIGFAGCQMMGRVMGACHVEELDSIGDDALRYLCEKLALAIGTEFILQRKKIHDIREAVLLVRRVRTEVVKGNENR